MLLLAPQSGKDTRMQIREKGIELRNRTAEMMEEEMKQRAESDFCLYVLTPKMEGFFSVAEVVDDSNKRPAKTVFCFINKDEGKTFSDVQVRSLEQVKKMVKRNGATCFDTLNEVIDFLNHQ